jgi:hypothetical protein
MKGDSMDELDLGEIVDIKREPRALNKPIEVPVTTFVPSGQRLLVSRALLGHMHVRGMTGSGKTSLTLISLIRQLMRPYQNEGRECRDPIIVFDLAGDTNLFWNLREFADAQRPKRRFRFLALDPDLESYFFPPFQAVPAGETNVIRISQMLISAFHLEYGLAYGGSYFSQQNLAALLQVARKLVTEGGSPTLEDVARYLDDPANRREFKDAQQIRMSFDVLLEHMQLQSVGEPEREIDMARALEDSEVIYFFCPTLLEPMSARLVAGLGLYTAVNAAVQRFKPPKREPRCVRIIVDEFQEIVGRSLAALLAQSRKFGVSLILANQSSAQLESHDLSLADQVFEGTAIKQYFTSLGDDVEVLQSLSRTKSQPLTARTMAGLAQSSVSQREQLVPTLERDTILDVTYTFGRSFVVVNDGRGHKEPIVVDQTHDTPDHSNRPMPVRTQPLTVKAAHERVPVGKRVPLDDPPRRERHDAIRELIRAKLDAERWSD